MSKILKIGFSTCPNDTFIFDALVHHKIDAEGYTFEVIMADVEELNQMALQGKLDVVKVSYAHLPAIHHQYLALTAGGAMGYNCGPLLVAKDTLISKHFADRLVAIPGEHTTARYLLKRFFPNITKTLVMLFSEIEDAVVNGEVDAGLIIHESRFSYQLKGLLKIADLGELWHQDTHLPLPLGCIAVKRSRPVAELLRINHLVQQSVHYAQVNPQQTMTFVKQHAVSLSEDVIMQHIQLYVNNLSIDPGVDGMKAARMLLADALPETVPIFVTEI